MWENELGEDLARAWEEGGGKQIQREKRQGLLKGARQEEERSWDAENEGGEETASMG